MARPVVVVCLDGMGPEYLDAAFEAGKLPRMAAWAGNGGLRSVGEGILPSFTNPNNISIVTGLSAAEHGLCGNHYFDRRMGREISTEDPACLRAETLLAHWEREGARVATVTAKDKLRRLLGAGRGGPSFSAERAEGQTFGAWGIGRFDEFVGQAVPEIYSAEASMFVLRAGLKLFEKCRPDLIYLSTTDYLQHRWAPGAAELDGFLAEADRCLGELCERGAVVAVTADHGMNAKPRVVYLGEHLPRARVVLPITDPYVRHHGALGGCAFVDTPEKERVAEVLRGIDGVEVALERGEAARRYELPSDRIGDVVVFAAADTAFGKTRAEHDLSTLEGPLRSHGGLAEARVPLLLSEAVQGEEPTRSRDLMAAALRTAGWAS